MHYHRHCAQYSYFLDRAQLLTKMLLNQVYVAHRLKPSLHILRSSSQSGWPLRSAMYQTEVDLLLFTYVFYFIYHWQDFFRTWLHIWVTRSVSYKKQNLFTLREYLSSPVFIIGWFVLLISLFVCVVLWFTLWLPCCDLHYNDCGKQYYLHLDLQLFVGGIMFYLRYLCLLVHSGVQHILCCVFGLFIFVFCTICW